MAEPIKLERNTRALVLGALLALAIVSLVTVTHPPDVLWDEPNGHRTMVGRSGNVTMLKMLFTIFEAAALVFFLPVMGFVLATLVAQVFKRPVGVAWLLWILWSVSLLGWLVIGSDWLAMSD